MEEVLIKVNPNIVEQIVQQRTEQLRNQLIQAQTELETANAQLTDTQVALCDVYEMITALS